VSKKPDIVTGSVIPITGTRCWRPMGSVLSFLPALFVENLRSRSAALDTTMAIDGEKGVITVSQTNR
jgi:hypothetical protein